LEIKKLNKIIYWNIKPIDGWLYISSPIMEAELPFNIKRSLVKEFKNIENIIKSKKLKGWICYTSIFNLHIMKMFTKVGAIPYKIEQDNLWFKKDLK